jgi:porin
LNIAGGSPGSRIADASMPGVPALLFFGWCSPAIAQDGPRHTIALSYTGEVWRNASGGVETGDVYLDKTDIVLGFESVGWAAQLVVQVTNGEQLTEPLVGDLAVVSNIDAPYGVRIFEGWVQRQGDKWRTKVGLIDLNSEFDAKENGALFVNSAHGIGLDFSQSGVNGPSIFPVTGLGVVGDYTVVRDFVWRWGVFDAAPGRRADRNATGLQVRADEGALLVTEAGWDAPIAARLAIGGWRYTSEFPVHDAPQSGRPDSESYGGYIVMDGKARFGSGREEAGYYLRAGVAAGAVNLLAVQYSGGFVWSDVVLPGDALGLAFVVAEFSDLYLRAQRSSGADVRRREVALEATWRVPIHEHVTLQPDLQYIRRSDRSTGDDHALVVGLRFVLSASVGRQ